MNFPVSKSDVRDVLITTLAGALLFGAAGIGSILGRKKIAMPEFVTDTKRIQSDAQLCSWLAEAERDVKPRSELYVTFLRMVHEIDRILIEYHQFITKRNENILTPADASRRCQVIVDQESALRLQRMVGFLAQCKTVMSAQEYVAMEDAITRVKEHVRQYTQNVWNFAQT